MATDIAVTHGLSAKETAEAADTALELKQKAHHDLVAAGGVSRFMRLAKATLLFQPDCKWDDMLSGAPISISIMGSIFVASTTEFAERVTVVPPEGGFKAISTFVGDTGEMSLQACLVQVSHLGSAAFSLASVNMSAIATNSVDIEEDIKTIGKLLKDPESARLMLGITMDSLKKKAEACGKKSSEIAEEYQKWLSATCEVHAACCQSSTVNAEKQRANEVHLAAAETQVVSKKQAVEAAKENMETLKESLKHAEEQYKKAADEFPSGWELIGQEIVSNLASTLTSAVNQAVPALINQYTVSARMKEAKEGVNIFNGLFGGVKEKDGNLDSSKNDHQNISPANNAPRPNAPVLPEDYTDPAYNIVRSAYTYIESLITLLTGKNGNIDWESITTTDAQKTKNGISVIKVMLEKELKQLGTKPNEREPTKKLKAILQACIPVATELDKFTSAAMKTGEKPADKSETVTKWQDAIHKAYVDATPLWQDSQNIPGPETPPVPPPGGVQPYPTPDGAGLRAQIIGAATTKLNSTSSVLQTSQTNFQESSKVWVQMINEMGAIQSELSTLKAAKVTLEQIRAILIKCIELLVQLQTQINKMNAFFAAVRDIVQIAIDNQVKPFLAQIGAVTNEPLHLGGYVFTEFIAILIYNSMLNIRCYFSLFQDLAKLWNEMHLKYLMKGLEIVGDMQKQSEGGEAGEKLMKAKQAKLNAYTGDTLPKVKKLLEERQQECMDTLESKSAAIAKEVPLLPANPKPLQKAIDHSSLKAIKAAKEGIEASGSYSRAPMPAFSDE